MRYSSDGLAVADTTWLTGEDYAMAQPALLTLPRVNSDVHRSEETGAPISDATARAIVVGLTELGTLGEFFIDGGQVSEELISAVTDLSIEQFELDGAGDEQVRQLDALCQYLTRRMILRQTDPAEGVDWSELWPYNDGRDISERMGDYETEIFNAYC